MCPSPLNGTSFRKRYWKVSMAALIKRAGQLEVLDETRVTSMYKMLSARGWRKIEPMPIPVERAEVLESWSGPRLMDT
jgi:Zn-dependent peptidase ImmA (M78 family)